MGGELKSKSAWAKVVGFFFLSSSSSFVESVEEGEMMGVERVSSCKAYDLIDQSACS